ncbi:hypothetical protein P152DRAFT_178284 [Eremomyces bilateralis CBS 781.70]|uniref:Mannosyltransferase n=1 Tax=Eremomyces bilateralis CBS 781.70 TaxID=1392243 RepID=A0A6G1FTF6_9PEZI|nr:uncharacterized protein P152DRAFT_178284 [Eremomyces bilateralis CBS 781.70]KAF1808959.1 hypothetical protein P152DRAFT_178284 [Eremomyces bilateralis CBS 781.70]
MALPLDVLVSLLIPTSIFVHLYFSSFTKVEESFGIQAVHDITSYGMPLGNVTAIAESFDHVSFPGAVPRSFIGPIILSVASFLPLGFVRTPLLKQVAVRGILGLVNSLSLLHLLETMDTAFGTAAGTWFALFQASQFRVNYYASRTVPNMFAFGLTTYASSLFVQAISAAEPTTAQKKYQSCLYYLALVATVVRSEIALLLIPMSLSSVLWTWKRTPAANRSTSQLLSTAYNVAISPIFVGLCYGLVYCLPLDTMLWFPAYHDISQGFPRIARENFGKLQDAALWPELAALKFNVINGNASDWGIAPWHFYLSSAVPGLLLNPLTYIICIPTALLLSPRARSMAWPCLLFIAGMSFVGHKEWRFIVYVSPILTGIAAIGAARLTEPKKSTSNTRPTSSKVPRRTFSATLQWWILLLSVSLTAIVSGATLFLSTMNYPGGTALVTLRHHLLTDPTYASTLPPHDPAKPLRPVPINIWASNLALQTGITRFLTSGAIVLRRGADTNPAVVTLEIDKTDNATQTLDPEFWSQFDFAIVERPEQLIGAWNTLDTVYSYAGLSILRPGENGSGKMPFTSQQRVKEGQEGAGVIEAAEEVLQDIVSKGSGNAPRLDTVGQWKTYVTEIAPKVWSGAMSEKQWDELYSAVEAWSRVHLTRGYWVEVKMEPKLQILERVRHSIPA